MSNDNSRWFKIQCFNHRLCCYESKLFIDKDEGLDWAYDKQETHTPICAQIGRMVNGRFDGDDVIKSIGKPMAVNLKSDLTWNDIFEFVIKNSK